MGVVAIQGTMQVAIFVFYCELLLTGPDGLPNERLTVLSAVFAKVQVGAVRNAVGIRCGAFSGNMKVSFQAARSIG